MVNSYPNYQKGLYNALFKTKVMAIEIQEINDRQILVNEKLVVKNSDDNWISKIELTQNESTAFYNYINTME